MLHYFSIVFFSLFSSIFCAGSTSGNSLPVRRPYIDLYSIAVNSKSHSFESRLNVGEIFANFSFNETISGYFENFTDVDPLILSNSSVHSSPWETVIGEYSSKRKDRFMYSISNAILNFILRRSNLLSDAVDGDVSIDCLADLYYFAESIRKADGWALKVFDSLGKPPPGLQSGNVIWTGNYDQCLEVAAPRTNVTIHVGPIRYTHEASYDGQYCLLSIIKKDEAVVPVPEGYLLAGLTVGICAPSQCTSNMLTIVVKEIETMFNKTLSKFGLQVGGVKCPKKKEYWDSTGVLAITVLAIMLTLVFVGTVYDFVSSHRAKTDGKMLDDEDASIDADQHIDNIVGVGDERLLVNGGSAKWGNLGRVFTSFSILANGKRIFSTTPSNRHRSTFSIESAGALVPASNNDLPCLHGIRFLSMAWIILGHTYYFSFSMSANPLDRLDPTKRDFWFQAIIQAAYACDTFFMISACLVATYFFSVADRYPQMVGTCRFWVAFYLQRFIRLTPPYMLILCVYIGLWKYVGGGPFWPSEGFEINDCRRTWWSNLFYINNYLNIPIQQEDSVITGREYCAAWTWYLANDMQFYWISPLVLYPIFKARQSRRWALIGYSILMSFIVVGIAVTGIIARVNQLPPNMFPADLSLRDKAEFMKDELFFKPYPHLPCYAVGLLLALALRRHQQNSPQKMSKIIVVIGWSLSFSFAMAIIFGLWPNYRGHPFVADLSACYAATSRFVFAVCVAWVAYACLTGYGGLVNKFLAWSLFKPLSRLTFVAYLIHPMLLFAYFFSRRTPFYYTEFVMVWFFGSFLLFSYLAAIGVALVFEYPFTALNRRFIKQVE